MMQYQVVSTCISYTYTGSRLGTALDTESRIHLGLHGYIPVAVEDLEMQKTRALRYLRSKTTSLDKYIFMAQLRNTNIRLFYKLVCDELKVCNNEYIGTRNAHIILI